MGQTSRRRRLTKNPGRKTSRKNANKKSRKMPGPCGSSGVPALLQSHWSKESTLLENYENIGLSTNINRIPKDYLLSVVQDLDPKDWNEMDAGLIKEKERLESLASTKTSIKEEGEIIYDADGNVIDYKITKVAVVPSEEEDHQNDSAPVKPVIAQMEAIAAKQVKRVHPPLSEPLRHFLSKAAAKYNRNTERMARDIKLNTWQMTAKEVERYLRIYDEQEACKV